MKKKISAEIVSNRKARHEYEILEVFEAGIVLQGTEIKSLRDGGGSLQEAFAKIIRLEAWLFGCQISPYKFGNIHNHEEKRERKLLLHKREIQKLKAAVAEKGLSLVPLSLYFKNGRVKVSLALARGKKLFDKRASLKEKSENRQLAKATKQFI